VPELRTRKRNEDAFVAALQDAWLPFLDTLDNPSRFDFDAFERDSFAALLPPLADTYRDAADNFIDLVDGLNGYTLDPSQIEDMARQWAHDHASDLAGELTKTTRDRFAAINREEFDSTDDQLAALLEVFGLTRLENIGITETTGAITAGELGIASEFADETGLQLIPIWHTAEDDLVCEICEPLNDTGVEIYGLVSSTGPPAHPRCRCDLTYEPE
jgi:hypothetical protein